MQSTTRRTGIVVTASQHAATSSKLAELAPQPGFRETFLAGGAAPQPGSVLKQPRLAATLARLARAGLADFYRGQARAIDGARSRRDRQSRRARRFQAPPRAARDAARARALRGHGLQHPAAHAGRRLAPDPRYPRPARDRRPRSPGRRLRASRGRGDEAGVRHPRPLRHRSGVHGSERTGAAGAPAHR